MNKSLLFIFTLVIGAITTQVFAQNINIPDAKFKNALLNQYVGVDSTGLSVIVDMNRDGEIQQNEADRIRQLILVGNIYNVGDTISDLTGIENFKNLELLQCGFNKLTEIKLDNLTKLTTLSCPNNKLTSLDLTHLKNLTNLYCWNNQITKLDLTQLTLLKELDCSKNAIEELYINSENLSNLDISYNKLQTLDTKGFKNIQKLRAESNHLKEIKLDDCPKLEDLRLYANALESIDITHCPKLKFLECPNNNLKSMYLKNGVNNMTEDGFDYYFEFNKNLKYICTDDSERGYILGEIRSYRYTNMIINSLCLSNIESTFHTLKANARYDVNSNGCSLNDIIFTNLKYKVVNSIDSAILLPNNEGLLSVTTNIGSYTIEPIFNHPYFFSNPSSIVLNLPSDTLLSKICISPKGNFNDLAVSIIPVRAARPGFSDAQYKIVYKNQGTTTQSGNVTFQFDDDKMNVITSSPVANQSDFGLLRFNFTNLAPFESRSVLVTMRTNAPTDNPAVNVNDILNFSVNITAQTDETPDDNTAVLYQTVIGSYDPNDKTCLEGDIITPDMVGK
ncbi:MAG: leucine-rich repeat domain-containing protein, partial [Chitinophagales bacterium]|nr:leucine-rich repeat domain-containing protein [Chitinophagales bacterium]